MKNSNNTIGNRTRDLSACSAVPQLTAPPRVPVITYSMLYRPTYFYIITSLSTCVMFNMALFCSNAMLCFPVGCSDYFLIDFKVVSVALIISCTAFVFTSKMTYAVWPLKPSVSMTEITSQAFYVAYNVIPRRVRLPTVAVEKQCVLYILCVCSLRYPERYAHAPCYIVICGLSGCTIFFHITS